MSLDEQAVKQVLTDVELELVDAFAAYGPFNSVHEGYGIILEELDELWDEIKKKIATRDPQAMYNEAIQVAAMAMEFAMLFGRREGPKVP